MIVEVTTQNGELVQVHVAADEASSEATTEVEGTGPNPIAPEGKELLWGAGSFIVFLVIMRLFLFPRLQRGMAARRRLPKRTLELRPSAPRPSPSWKQHATQFAIRSRLQWHR